MTPEEILESLNPIQFYIPKSTIKSAIENEETNEVSIKVCTDRSDQNQSVKVIDLVSDRKKYIYQKKQLNDIYQNWNQIKGAKPHFRNFLVSSYAENNKLKSLKKHWQVIFKEVKAAAFQWTKVQKKQNEDVPPYEGYLSNINIEEDSFKIFPHSFFMIGAAIGENIDIWGQSLLGITNEDQIYFILAHELAHAMFEKEAYPTQTELFEAL